MKMARLMIICKSPQVIAIAVLAVMALFFGIWNLSLSNQLSAVRKDFASSTAISLNEKRALQEKLATQIKEYNNLIGLLDKAQKKTLDLENARKDDEKEIVALAKLTSIDPELLKKYSKVYFLSENYTPPSLTNINASYLIDVSKPVQSLDRIASTLDGMLRDANANGAPLKVLSGYRSFDYQKNLKTEYRITYGAGTANQFSADQGYSEHQLGTAFDFTTPDIIGAEVSFEKSTSFAWLTANAYKYGFVISYPKANKFYIYEPWHWRYVGKALASYLHTSNKYFYEVDQREIDGFLIHFFD